MAHRINMRVLRVSVLGVIVSAVATAVYAVCGPPSDTRTRDSFGWVTCTNGKVFTPLADSTAASLVIAVAENRPENAVPNAKIPTSAELASLTTEKKSNGQTAVQGNPYIANVTGGYTGTTDQIIQWGAAKWGIPPDWVRAQLYLESRWRQWIKGSKSTPLSCGTSCGGAGAGCGDFFATGNGASYPAWSRVTSPSVGVCQSLSFAQIKWNHPDANNASAGTEPLRWQSTAFAVDFYGATLRFYFDDPNGMRTAWGDTTYKRCQNWLSVGGWFQPYPWASSSQQGYANNVQSDFNNKVWTQSCMASDTC